MKNHRFAVRHAARILVLLGLVLLGGLVFAWPSDAGELFVSPSGVDSAQCAQGAPCRHLDYAVNKALDGDTVRVAAGTYFFNTLAVACTGVPIRSVLCVVDKAITIIGGYALGTWNLDPAANPTIIDGQNTYRGVFIYSSSRPDVRLTMVNFTIQNAVARGIDGVDASAFGGGINSDNAPVTLENVAFINNKAIGVDTVSGQGGTGVGGALSIRSTRGGAVSYLNNVRFQGNSSIGGRGPAQGGFAFGAVFIYGSPAFIENATFLNNTATAGGTSGSGLFNGERPSGLGGAVSIMDGAVVTLARLTATGNQVTGGAGTQYAGGGFGGAVYAESATAIITDSLFQSNVALAAGSVSGGFAAGGGVLFYNSKGSIDRTQIIANRATGGNSSAGQYAGNGGGGGLYLWRGDPLVTLPVITVTNTVIADNIVELGQGTNPGGGGGLQLQGLTAQFSHVTFARNQLGPGLFAGQAVVVVPGGAMPNPLPGILNLENSVVADHVATPSGGAAIVVLEGNTINLNRGAFSGNSKDTNANGNPMTPGTFTGLNTMTTVGPSGFVSPGPPNYDYHLTSGSPFRGLATASAVSVDMDYQPRADGAPDLGADEYVAVACSGSAPDTDGDGIPDGVEQHEGTHVCAKDNDVFASTRLFLMQQYRDFFDREADIDGLLAWMASGMPSDALIDVFKDTSEFQSVVPRIIRLYLAYFNRIPDLPGLQSWTAQLRGGMSLNAISVVFASTGEFQSIYGSSLTNTQFVTKLYLNMLSRNPDPVELANWVAQLDSGAMTRGKMTFKFSKSPEFKQASSSEVIVIMMYYAMLRQVPDPNGLTSWVARLDAGSAPLSLIDALLAAPQYHSRFLP